MFMPVPLLGKNPSLTLGQTKQLSKISDLKEPTDAGSLPVTIKQP
jgi:hypothetical protein